MKEKEYIIQDGLKKSVDGSECLVLKGKNQIEKAYFEELKFEKGSRCNLQCVQAQAIYIPKTVTLGPAWNSFKYAFFECSQKEYARINPYYCGFDGQFQGIDEGSASSDYAVFDIDVNTIEKIDKLKTKGYAYFKTNKGLYIYDFNQAKAKMKTLPTELDGEKIVSYLMHNEFDIEEKFGDLYPEFKKFSSKIQSYINQRVFDLEESELNRKRNEEILRKQKQQSADEQQKQEYKKAAKQIRFGFAIAITVLLLFISAGLFLGSLSLEDGPKFTYLLILVIGSAVVWSLHFLINYTQSKKEKKLKTNKPETKLFDVESINPIINGVSYAKKIIDIHNKNEKEFREKQRLRQEIDEIRNSISRILNQIASKQRLKADYSETSTETNSAVRTENNSSIVYDSTGRISGTLEDNGVIRDVLGRETGYKIDGSKLYDENVNPVGFISDGKVYYYDNKK